MRDLVSGYDIIIVVILLGILYLIAHKVQETHIDRFNYYSHYTRALFLKIFAGMIFCCVYIFYYNGGDTQYYFTGTRCIVKMAGKNFGAFLQLMLGERTPELRSLFDYYTGWPTYFKDANSWAVCRFSVPFYLLGCGSYLGMTMVMNFLLFIPMWNFYKLFIKLYPKMSKFGAIALFYIPSVIFWGSGLLKDGWCLAAVLAIYTACHNIFVRKRSILKNIFKYLFWSYILISIRPYAFYTVLGTSMIWIGTNLLKTIDSTFIRVTFFPLVASVVVIIFVVFMKNSGNIAEGHYATVDEMMTHAVVIQDDLKRDYYGANSFDIGTFDASISGMLAKLPQATIAGMFRPFIWEARTPFMLMAGLENIVLLLLSIWALLVFRLKLFSFLFKDGFQCSLAIFVIVFAFFIGLTIANFGALVRYRIILQPFFCLILGRLWFLHRQEKLESLEE